MSQDIKKKIIFACSLRIDLKVHKIEIFLASILKFVLFLF